MNQAMQYHQTKSFNSGFSPSRHSQRGASILGMAIVIGVVLLMLVIAMKVVPAYTEYASIKSILNTMEKTGLSGMSKSEIASAFDKRASIDNIESVRGKDLEISTDSAGRIVLSVEYQVVRPVLGNASALINFTATTEGL